MVSDKELVEEEQRLGVWPRRLLHVETLTSHEWEDGNVYGGYISPRYNAITYTWGRRRIEDPKGPDSVSALPIKFKGPGWRIPSIKPSHFTVDEFRNILKVATTHIPKDKLLSQTNWQPPEFVWVDIACIDQSESNPRSDAEIGRQAIIFRHADVVYTWLTTTRHQNFAKNLKILFEFKSFDHLGIWNDTAMAETQHLPEARRASSALTNILSDLWFSSLWTLQEAYLRPDAIILSRKGETYPLFFADAMLMDLFHKGTRIGDDLHGKLSRLPLLSRADGKEFSNTLSLVKKTGISALGTGIAMAVYSSAIDRTATRAVDQIYAIQQIFGLRLGKTSLDARLRVGTSLDQLNEQFSVEMLRCHPLHGALFVRSTPTEIGKGWMIGRNIAIPSRHRFGNVAADFDGKATVREAAGFSNESVHGELWARFKGDTCSYLALDQACTRVDMWFPLTGILPATTFEVGTLYICPDNSVELQKTGVSWDDYIGTSAGEKRPAEGELQRRLREKLREIFAPDQLTVLSLGSDRTAQYQLGLLMVRCKHARGFTYYRRFAVLSWDMSYTEHNGRRCTDREFLSVKSGWSMLSERFG